MTPFAHLYPRTNRPEPKYRDYEAPTSEMGPLEFLVGMMQACFLFVWFLALTLCGLAALGYIFFFVLL